LDEDGGAWDVDDEGADEELEEAGDRVEDVADAVEEAAVWGFDVGGRIQAVSGCRWGVEVAAGGDDHVEGHVEANDGQDGHGAGAYPGAPLPMNPMRTTTAAATRAPKRRNHRPM